MLTSGYPRRPTGAARAALAAYRADPLSTRVHATVRWWSAPFPAVEAALPASGRVLEIGCGHGLFSSFAAMAGPARSVVGVDIDARKIAQAQAARRRLPGVDLRFEVAPSGAVPAGPWDAVVVIDMLYLLPRAEQRDLLAAAAAQLAPGRAVADQGDEPDPGVEGQAGTPCRRPWRCPSWASPNGPSGPSRRVRGPRCPVGRPDPSTPPRFDFVAARGDGRLAGAIWAEQLELPAGSAPAAPAPPADRPARRGER